MLYANIDEFNPLDYELEYDKLSVMDKWLLSKLNSMVKTVDESLGAYKIPEATKALAEFVDDLSNWYVRRGRERYWAKDMPQDKINAYMTLYTALVTTCQTAAPMVPFLTEDIYQNIVRKIDADAPISIHLTDFPAVVEEFIDKDLETAMDEVLKCVVFGRAARNTANIKSRQPIAKMYIKGKTLEEKFLEIVREELNVKAIEFKDDLSAFTSYTFKPQLRTVGPKYGKQLGGIKEYLANVNGSEAMNTLKSEGALKFTVGDTEVSLAEEDLLIDVAQSEDFVTEGDNNVTVVIETKLTPELIEEGFVRELISKLQTMRKEADFNVTDRIKVYVSGNEKIKKIMDDNADEIKRVVLGDDFIDGTASANSKEWNINGEKVTLGVERV